jgi:hypothetical protein
LQRNGVGSYKSFGIAPIGVYRPPKLKSITSWPAAQVDFMLQNYYESLRKLRKNTSLHFKENSEE